MKLYQISWLAVAIFSKIAALRLTRNRKGGSVNSRSGGCMGGKINQMPYAGKAMKTNGNKRADINTVVH